MSEMAAEVISIIIVNYNTRDHLFRCLASIYRWPPSILQQIIVIDNASTDGSADLVEREYSAVLLIRSHVNRGYGAAINTAVQHASGAWLMFLNPDIEVAEGSVDALISFARVHSYAGVIGPRLLYGDGTPQASAKRFLSTCLSLLEGFRFHLLLPSPLRSRLFLGTYFDQNRTRRVGWVSGACHFIPRVVWDRLGPLTEETFCGSDDYDYCYRAARRGYEVWLNVSSTMTHHCSVAVQNRWTPWEVEQLSIHNFNVVLSLHWRSWQIAIFYTAEICCCLLEMLRNKFRPRYPTAVLSSFYGVRLRRRLSLMVSLLLGREGLRRRFEPTADDNGLATSSTIRL